MTVLQGRSSHREHGTNLHTMFPPRPTGSLSMRILLSLKHTTRARERSLLLVLEMELLLLMVAVMMILPVRMVRAARSLRVHTMNLSTQPSPRPREECNAVIRAAFLPLLVSRLRERLRVSLSRTGLRIEYFRPPGLAFVHNTRIFEFLHERFLPPG